jgi:DNA processing protein
MPGRLESEAGVNDERATPAHGSVRGRTGSPGVEEASACEACLRRTLLLALLSPFLDRVRDRYGRPEELLTVGDEDLIACLAGSRRSVVAGAYEAFDPEEAARRIARSGQSACCVHADAYPARLRDLAAPPAVLHSLGTRAPHDAHRPGTWTGEPAATSEERVAIVGARRASDYGREIARALGRGLSAAGVTVVSGMAMGVDAAAHEGALEVGGRTAAVLGGGADVPYPQSKRLLHARLAREAIVMSEMPPGFVARRWSFPVRNRIIAALASLVVVVEGGERSGSLITARIARDIGREVAAVPGRVTSPVASGPNALLFDGAHLVRDAQDVLDLVFGAGARRAAPRRDTSGLDPSLLGLLEAVAGGRATVPALTAAGHDAAAALAGLADLELRGLVSRRAGGVYVVAA